MLLLDPSIKSDLVAWQHTRIIKSMLYQNYHKQALKYMRIKRLPLQVGSCSIFRCNVMHMLPYCCECFKLFRTVSLKRYFVSFKVSILSAF